MAGDSPTDARRRWWRNLLHIVQRESIRENRPIDGDLMDAMHARVAGLSDEPATAIDHESVHRLAKILIKQHGSEAILRAQFLAARFRHNEMSEKVLSEVTRLVREDWKGQR